MTSESFARQATAAGISQVELGNIAAQKAENPAVKSLAEALVKDHAQTTSELRTIATQESIALPTTLPADADATAHDLSQKSGTAFDRAYLAQMVQDQEKAVALFRDAATTDSVGSDLRDLAHKALPRLEHHLEEARQLDQQLGVVAEQDPGPPPAPNLLGVEVVP